MVFGCFSNNWLLELASIFTCVLLTWCLAQMVQEVGTVLWAGRRFSHSTLNIFHYFLSLPLIYKTILYLQEEENLKGAILVKTLWHQNRTDEVVGPQCALFYKI